MKIKSDKFTIRTIKTIHTIIWVIMALSTFYILYCGLTKTFNLFLWISISLLMIESAVIITNKWTCPLTPIAMKYTSDRNDNFDIYLPKWLAKYNKLIFGVLLVIGLILVIYNLMIK